MDPPPATPSGAEEAELREALQRAQDRVQQARTALNDKKAKLIHLQSTSALSSLSEGEATERLEAAVRALAKLDRLDLASGGASLGGPSEAAEDSAYAGTSTSTHVKVWFGRESLWFRLSNATTFRELALDACSAWGVESGTLRDEENEIFTGNARVSQTLAQAGATKTSTVIKLVAAPVHRLPPKVLPPSTGPLPSSLVHPSEFSGTSQLGSNNHANLDEDALFQSNNHGSYLLNASSYHAAATHPLGAGSESHIFRDRLLPIEELERESRIRSVASLSPYLFDAASRHRLPSVYVEKDDELEHKARSCVWLGWWAVVVAVLTAAAVLRFQTSSAFVSTDLVKRGLQLPSLSPLPTASSVDLTWLWLETVLVPQLFPLTDATSGTVNAQQVKLGSVLMKQSRVAPQTNCRAWSRNTTSTTTTCLPVYTVSVSQTSGFAPQGAEADSPYVQAAFTYDARAAPRAVDGVLAEYDKGGYSASLNGSWTADQALDALGLLRSAGWLDDATRSLIIEFNLGNVNLGVVVGSEVVLEYGANAIALSHATVRVLPLSAYGSTGDTTRYKALFIVGDVLVLVYAATCVVWWILVPKARDVANLRDLCLNVWNLLSIVLLCVALGQVVSALVYEFESVPSRIDALTQTDVLTDVFPMTQTYEALVVLNGLSLLFAWLTAFKHLQRDEGARVLYQSMHRAFRPLTSLGLILVVGVGSMSVWANLAWGPHSAGWVQLNRVVVKLLGMSVGGPMDFGELRTIDAQAFFLVLFFLLWFGFLTLFVFQLFGAIVLDAMAEVRFVTASLDEERRIAAGKKKSASSRWHDFARAWKLWGESLV